MKLIFGFNLWFASISIIYGLFDFIQDALALTRYEASNDLLSHIFGAVAEQVLQLFGVKLFNDLLLSLYDIRVLLVEDIESSLIFEEHLQKSPSTF